MNHNCANPKCQSKDPSFYKDKRTKNGLRSWCKECCSLSSKKYNKLFSKERSIKRRQYKEMFYSIPQNKEHKKQQERERYKNDSNFRERVKQNLRENHLKRKYGLTLADWNLLLKDQNNSCAICQNTFILDNPKHKLFPRVDHNHQTGKIRGLLCNACNTVLGFFKEDITVLSRAQHYITRNL